VAGDARAQRSRGSRRIQINGVRSLCLPATAYVQRKPLASRKEEGASEREGEFESGQVRAQLSVSHWLAPDSRRRLAPNAALNIAHEAAASVAASICQSNLNSKEMKANEQTDSLRLILSKLYGDATVGAYEFIGAASWHWR